MKSMHTYEVTFEGKITLTANNLNDAKDQLLEVLLEMLATDIADEVEIKKVKKIK